MSAFVCIASSFVKQLRSPVAGMHSRPLADLCLVHAFVLICLPTRFVALHYHGIWPPRNDRVVY